VVVIGRVFLAWTLVPNELGDSMSTRDGLLD
jgi:hypothetical protein